MVDVVVSSTVVASSVVTVLGALNRTVTEVEVDEVVVAMVVVLTVVITFSTRMFSTAGSAESSWNAAMTAMFARRTAINAPMNPLFLGT